MWEQIFVIYPDLYQDDILEAEFVDSDYVFREEDWFVFEEKSHGAAAGCRQNFLPQNLCT